MKTSSPSPPSRLAESLGPEGAVIEEIVAQAAVHHRFGDIVGERPHIKQQIVPVAAEQLVIAAFGLDQLVIADAALEQVVAEAADEGVVAALAAKPVVARAAVQIIVALACEDLVEALARADIVLARAHVDDVVRAPGKQLNPLDAVEMDDPVGRRGGDRAGKSVGARSLRGEGRRQRGDGIAIVDEQGVGAGAAMDGVGPGAGHEKRIVVGAAVQDVVAGEAVENVVAAEAVDHVRLRRSDQLVIARRPDDVGVLQGEHAPGDVVGDEIVHDEAADPGKRDAARGERRRKRRILHIVGGRVNHECVADRLAGRTEEARQRIVILLVLRGQGQAVPGDEESAIGGRYDLMEELIDGSDGRHNHRGADIDPVRADPLRPYLVEVHVVLDDQLHIGHDEVAARKHGEPAEFQIVGDDGQLACRPWRPRRRTSGPRSRPTRNPSRLTTKPPPGSASI